MKCKNTKIYFISGVCGVGKTTIINHLNFLLANKYYDIHDFDKRGVPDNATRDWRKEETQYWINLGKQNFKKGINTIICGFSNPEEISKLEKDVYFILLDANKETIKERISGRYKTQKSIKELKRVSGKTLDLFIRDNANFSEVLRNIFEKDKRCDIVNTNNKAPKDVAKDVVKIII